MQIQIIIIYINHIKKDDIAITKSMFWHLARKNFLQKMASNTQK